MNVPHKEAYMYCRSRLLIGFPKVWGPLYDLDPICVRPSVSMCVPVQHRTRLRERLLCHLARFNMYFSLLFNVLTMVLF